MSLRERSMHTCKGRIHAVESFGSVDGPGIRYIFFLQGCPLRCKYCHNPATWSGEGGMEMTAKEALEKALRYKPYWKNNGGITVSGGEPLLQADFVCELFTLAKAKGVSTCLDTSGVLFSREGESFSRIQELLKVTDLVLLDLKHIDPIKHKELTGQSNVRILDFAKYLAQRKIPVWIRHVLVPGITDDAESLHKLGTFIASLGNVQRVEVLPYHRMAIAKYEELGIAYPIPEVREPDEADVAKAEQLLRAKEYLGYRERKR